MTDKIEKMTDDDFKKIMQQLGMPESKSLYSALKQVENHTWQAARMVPEGYVVVPVEPTQKMMGFGAARHGSRLNLCMNDAAMIYEAMLAAAPEISCERSESD